VGQGWAARGLENSVRKAESAAFSSESIVKLHLKISMSVYRDCGVEIGKQIVATPQRKPRQKGDLVPFLGQCFAKWPRVWCNRPNFLN
jgi:hypothetical protein